MTTKLHQKPGKPPGFALVVTISLMVLLSLLAVGLLSLSTIALRHSSNDLLAREARQNARLALTIAIGELQSACGPDRRITSTASIRGVDVSRPHLTGVWEGWKWDGNGPAPDYGQEKEKRFLRWLASAPEGGAERSLDYADQATASDEIELVGDLASSEDIVTAHAVPIAAGRGPAGRFAWAVFDESGKTPTRLPEPGDDTLASSLDRFTAAPLPGYGATTEREWDALAELSNERLKLVTPGQAALAELAAKDRSFHDLTSRTAGIAADVGVGGLATDLSRLFDDPNGLPRDYESRFLYSGTDTPLVSAPERFDGANPFPAPDPSWRLLRSHYRTFEKLEGGEREPTISASAMERPKAGTTPAIAQDHPYFHDQQILPVISKAQFVFSLSFGWHDQIEGAARNNNDRLPESQKDHYVTWLVIDPVITLWNPYNVRLKLPTARVDLYRLPLAFRLYKNGRLMNNEWTHLANTFLGGDLNSRKNTFYRLNLLPEEDESQIVMEPGEHLVFTATNHVTHYLHRYMEQGLDLRPGFSPPAGNSSVETVGGTSTLNLFVSSAGELTGNAYGKKVRTIAVRPDDKVQIEVKPLRAEVDELPETGGKEISGFLKYYVGDPDQPQLVGGIELDYGDREDEFLDTFETNDLPEIVVSGDIPKKVKADNYVGQAPPPVVRFKEPFLISTFQLKTERDSKFPSRSWIDNAPANAYASSGLDQTEPWREHQYELQWEAMTDWPPSVPTIEISNVGNRGYGGSGVYAQSGLEFAVYRSLPLRAPLSIAQFRHAPINHGGQLPLISQAIANSFHPHIITPENVRQDAGERVLIDHSFFANTALFDGYFLSGLGDSSNSTGSSADAETKLRAFFDQGTPLPNSRFLPHRAGRSTEELIELLLGDDGHERTAAHLLIDSPFNINCTRIDVWEALLGSSFGQNVPVTNVGVVEVVANDRGVPVLRNLPAAGADLESQVDPLSQDNAKWTGYRRLEPDQIRTLAEGIVREVRERGPFLSLAEFVNRRPEDTELGRSGPLQSAIDRAGINVVAIDPLFDLPDGGNTADGSPGVLNQADLLTPISPHLTARGDTFRIRACGEARDASGRSIRVWCEAVVQRIPEYVDPSDAAREEPTSSVNERFGRRFEQISFRWLNNSEV